jgi:hypothetical protein
MKRMGVAAAEAFGKSSVFVVILLCAALISAAVTGKVDAWRAARSCGLDPLSRLSQLENRCTIRLVSCLKTLDN